MGFKRPRVRISTLGPRPKIERSSVFFFAQKEKVPPKTEQFPAGLLIFVRACFLQEFGGIKRYEKRQENRYESQHHHADTFKYSEDDGNDMDLTSILK